MNVRATINRRIVRPNVDLQADSKTIAYELRMLLAAASEFAAAENRLSNQCKNALIESFAIHCRALIFFLYGHLDEIECNRVSERLGPLKDTDILATDYASAWGTSFVPPTEELIRSKRRADKHVAHITTDRREVNQPGSTVPPSVWQLDAATRAIAGAFSQFLSLAPATSFWPDALTEMKQLVGSWAAASVTTATTASQSQVVSTQSPHRALTGTTDARTTSPAQPISLTGRTQ